MVIGVPLWWLAHLRMPVFTVSGVWTAFSALLIAGIVMSFVRRKKLRRFIRQNILLLLCLEVGFALAFVTSVLVRLGNPDLWHPWFSGEKFMEMAIWNGILRSPEFPPLDVHFAGEHLNYYYFGHYMLAVLTKLTGIWTEVAFNLAVPTIFGLTFLLSWAAIFYYHSRTIQRQSVEESEREFPERPWARNLAKSLWAPFFLLVAGNPWSGLLAFGKLKGFLANEDATASRPGFLDWNLTHIFGSLSDWYNDMLGSHYWWEVSRVIPKTINEFPAWSFVFGDLHAHLLVVPWTILLFCLTVVAVFYVRSRMKAAAILVWAGLVCGLIAATNPWDLPVAFLLAGIGIFLASIQLFPSKGVSLAVSLAALALFGGVATVASLPFWQNFATDAVGGLGLVPSGDMPFAWLSIWGLFYFPVVCWLIHKTRSYSARLSASNSGKRLRLVLLFLIGTALLGISVALQQATFGLTILPFGLAFVLLIHFWKSKEERLIISWCILVLGIWAGSQVLFVKDFLSGGDYYRMNTVFKYFFQGWLLASLVCAILIPKIWREIRFRLSRSTQTVVAVIFSLLLVFSLGFVVVGVPARLGQRFPFGQPPRGTLNGLAFMKTAVYVEPSGGTIELFYDLEAIDWINSNLGVGATVLESAQVDYYRSGGTRVASLTGLTGLYGMHQREQRTNAVTAERESLMRRLWEIANKEELLRMLKKNSVDLIYVGQLEQIEHKAGANLYREMAATGQLEILFENDKTMILALPDFHR